MYLVKFTKRYLIIIHTYKARKVIEFVSLKVIPLLNTVF